MPINGLTKTTLLDYPGRVAATLFLSGCNFRCPFCHNSGLVLSPVEEPEIPPAEILHFLKKRQGILEGVCISGGEPTCDKNLLSLVTKIHELGYSIKLDTNGSHPWILKKLVQNHLIDMVAMDIKACPDNYEKATGVKTLDLTPVLESAEYLMSGSIPYEFRTTVVKEIHTAEDFEKIGKWLSGAKAYYLQAYQDSPEVIIPGFQSFTLPELMRFRNILLETIPFVEIRGID